MAAPGPCLERTQMSPAVPALPTERNATAHWATARAGPGRARQGLTSSAGLAPVRRVCHAAAAAALVCHGTAMPC